MIDAFRQVFSAKPRKQVCSPLLPARQPDSAAAHLQRQRLRHGARYLRPGDQGDDDLIDDMLNRGFDVTNHQQMTITLRGFDSIYVRYDLSRGLEHELENGKPVVMCTQNPCNRGRAVMIVAEGQTPRETL